jgi:hypothetical protein
MRQKKRDLLLSLITTLFLKGKGKTQKEKTKEHNTRKHNNTTQDLKTTQNNTT